MARKRERAFAGFFAILFIVTSSAVTISVILTLIQQHNQNNAATTATNTSKNASSATAASSKEKPVSTTLQGTKLANFTPVQGSIPQLRSEDMVAGTGATVPAGANITVDYTGALASSGIIFQSSKDTGKPIPLSLSGVIQGWAQGIPGMKVGGTRRLFIPSKLAYGPNSQPGIPANSDLVFDVTVYKIN